MILKRRAPAKINLGLHVLRRRPDGYHDLETVFWRISWADELSVRPGAGLSLTCSDPTLPTNEDNLVMKAARGLARETGTAHGASLHLEKHLPHGAGLGGGSSDAAAALRLLIDHWGVNVPEDRLHALGAALGADVPFFLGPAAAYATCRGDTLSPLQDPATGRPYRMPYALVVVMPPVRVPTADAYRHVTPRAAGRPDLRAVVCSNDLDRWRRELVNDFEAAVFARYPAVRQVRDDFVAAGADYAALSGSGAAVFGVFADTAAARTAAEALRRPDRQVWIGS